MPSIRINEEAGVRYLQFGARWIQGAMRINRPWKLELEYTRDMLFPLLLCPHNSWPRRVLLVGMGAASLTKFLHRHFPRTRLDVVEIDPEVVMTAWQFFGLPEESRRLAIEIGDGYRFMSKTRNRYDLILVDGFDAKGRAGNLDSPGFYRNCLARLAPGGMVATNLLSRRGRPTASIDRLRKVFDDRLVVLPANDANTIALASCDRPARPSYETLKRRARELNSRTGLSLLSTLSALHKAG